MARRKPLDIGKAVEKLLAGDVRTAARLISLVENETEQHQEVMRRIYPHSGDAMILGVTGSAGAGKSTLTDHLIKSIRSSGKKVGAVLVDPSSPFSGGSLLGDRIRLHTHTRDPGVFIRSLASRGHLGGLSRATFDVIRIMEAMGMDVVIVETLGAGQDEVEIIKIAQTCLLVVTPGMGDDVQAMKAGIMEIADIIVLNKADLPGAEMSRRHLESALATSSGGEEEWKTRIVPTVAVQQVSGIDALLAAITEHQGYLRTSCGINEVRLRRARHELGFVYKEMIHEAATRRIGDSGNEDLAETIAEGRGDPYSIVAAILSPFLSISRADGSSEHLDTVHSNDDGDLAVPRLIM